MNTLLQDLRYGARLLLKSPGFSLVAILTLALGIGANTAIFSVVNAVLLSPLPYPQPEQMVRVFESTQNFPKFPMSPGNFLDYRARNKVFSDLAIYTREDVDLEGDRPERLRSMRVSSEFFRLLGFQPLLGRDFRREEEQPDVGRVAIISRALFERRFGADPQVVGSTIKLSGEQYTIIGVLPAGVEHVGGDYRSFGHGESVELWRPVDLSQREAVRFAHYMNAVGRMKAGVTREQAEAELNLIAAQLGEEYPQTNRNWQIRVSTLHEELVGRSRRMLLVLLGAVAFVLLIACANVAGLALARGSARAHEMAVRAAMGAGRGRLVRQLLVENLLIAILGGACGVIFALWAIDLIVRFGPEALPRKQMIGVDAIMLAFACGASILTGVLFGLAPALASSRPDLNGILKEGGRLSGGGRARLRAALVVAEVALSVVLLAGALLLARSFVKLQRVETGFRPAGVVTMSIAPPFTRYQNRPSIAAFYDRLLERLRAIPGVEMAATTSDLPWTGYDENLTFKVEGKDGGNVGGNVGSNAGGSAGGSAAGQTIFSNQNARARYHFTSSDYFRAIGTPLIAGRFFDGRDRDGAPLVVLINEVAARRYWPGESAVGRRITFNSQPKEKDWITVVGVVGDIKDTPGAAEAEPSLYWPHAQVPHREMFLALRTSGASSGVSIPVGPVGPVGPPVGLVDAVRREVAAIDKELALSEVRMLDEIAEAAFARERFALLLVSLFAGAAILLAAIGLYGVLSYQVAQRRREIGIRLALGARRGDVMRLVIGQGMRLVAGGLALGLAGALALTRLMASLLYETSARDPLSFAGVAVLLLLVAGLSCYLPARRAARTDPMIALRYE